MNRQTIEQIARRYGYVRWKQSGMIEQLRICIGKKNKRSRGLVLAKNVLTGEEHVLWPIDDYHCEPANLKRTRSKA
jgi:hypothetical protein